MPVSRDVNTDEVNLHFVDGQEMMVRHGEVCGRKSKPK
jgi:hypothetical protein